jgi:thiaminase
VTTDDLRERHGAAWAGATRHPFLVGVRDGTITTAAFDTWLGQDHLFVSDLLWFQARLLSRAAPDARRVLVDGCSGLVAELAWFEELAAARRLTLPASPMSATADYKHLLQRLDGQPAGVALTALWVIERVYLDAWRYAAPGTEALRPYVTHWTDPDFAAYVDALARTADRSAVVAGAADDVVTEVLRCEQRFWDTALAGGAG